MKKYVYCKNNILISKNDNETYVYDVKLSKFLLSKKGIKEVEQWIDENCEDESDTIIKNELLDIKNSLNKTRIVTLVFNSAEVCNLKCRYCFANEGTYNNFSEKKHMTLENYINAYEIINSDNQVLAIEFFGGEPLLNFSVIKKFCEYVYMRRKKLEQPIPKFGIITNGTLINQEIWNFFEEYNFSVTISLDGHQKINDKNRFYKNGKGTFYDIINNIKINTDSKGSHCAFNACEATLTCDILKQMDENDILEYIEFFDNLQCNTIAILFAIDDKLRAYEEDLSMVEKFDMFYKIYVEYCVSHILEGNLRNYHSDIINSIRAFIVGGEINFCKAGAKQIFINVNGEIYPCQRYYETKLKMGSITNYKSTKEKLEDYKNNYQSRINQDCLICEYRYVCEGAACPGSNLVVNGVENKYLKLMCMVNKARNTQVLSKLFEILTNPILKDLFLKKFVQYLNTMGEEKYEESIFE